MNSILFFLLFTLSLSCYSQKPDVTPISDNKAKSDFKGESNILIKVGTTCNFINKELYRNLNDGYSTEMYKAENTNLYINPYVSIGLEKLITKKIGFQLNFGFYQTLQKYTSSQQVKTPFNGTASGSATTYKIGVYEYLNNNVFVDFLPVYKIKNTRFLAGINVTRTSPTISTKVTLTDPSTGKSEVGIFKDRPEESYHTYSIIGIMQSLPVKSHEINISATYFGLLKKYDSGFNLMIGFLF